MTTSISADAICDERHRKLSGIRAIIASHPARAAVLATEFLDEVPNDPSATLLLGISHRFSGRSADAVDTLRKLVKAEPESSEAHLQLGLALREVGDATAAVRALERAAMSGEPAADAWLTLADVLFETGDRHGADRAYSSYAKQPIRDARLRKAAAAIDEGRLDDAQEFVRDRLAFYPTDIIALCLLGDICERMGRTDEAERYLADCLMLSPSYRRARHNHAVTLLRQNKLAEALRQCRLVLADAPKSVDSRKLLSAILIQTREYEESIQVCTDLLTEAPDQPSLWTSLGHMLKTVGRREECISAYRKAISLAPGAGEPYWGLANLKTFRVSDSELESIQAALEQQDLNVQDRVHLHFAAGRSLEQREDYDSAFSNYTEANTLHRSHHPYYPDELAKHVSNSKRTFTEEYFDRRASWGVGAADPIFVLGLPRSGSTLIEQILASHSRVEGTKELPNISAIAGSLARADVDSGGRGYTGNVELLKQERFTEMAEMYLEQTRIQRKLSKTFFIDKMPNNFAHIGLIHTMLPNARIIDVRRHPMACGVSLYKEHFARAQLFSYDLQDIGRYYTKYVELMDHFDDVLPGVIHRVVYEDLVNDTEREIRRMLDFCHLKFEESCLQFHLNKRSVSTASAEQVRAPINRDGVAAWRNFEPWLGSLDNEIGSLKSDYAVRTSETRTKTTY